jgi:cytochrome c biogenesis protein ResB
MEPLKKIYRFLISRQFAVWSLVLLALLLIVAGTLPDLSLLSENEFARLSETRPILFWISSHLQVSNLTRSPIFLILPGTVWLSTALCMIRRLRREVPQTARRQAAADSYMPDMATTFVDRSIEAVRGKIREILGGGRWRLEEVTENGAVRYIAQKGRQGYWGSIVFHLSMLVFLIGIIMSILGRFDAEMILTEGQSLHFAEDKMLRVNKQGKLSPRLPGTQITLSKFESEFVQDKYPVDYAAYLMLTDAWGNTHKEKVRVNHPLKHDRWEIFLHRYGFAPRFEIRNEQGKPVFDSFVNLIISRPDQIDHFDVPRENLRIETRFFPDHERDGERSVSRSPVPKNPVMRVRALEDGDPIGEADIPLGESAHMGEYQLRFADLRYWAWFGVVYDPGYVPIIVGFILCVAGLGVRFTDSEKLVHIKVEQREDSVHVALAGRSRYFPALFESEIGDIVKKLQPDMVSTDEERGT